MKGFITLAMSYRRGAGPGRVPVTLHPRHPACLAALPIGALTSTVSIRVGVFSRTLLS